MTKIATEKKVPTVKTTKLKTVKEPETKPVKSRATKKTTVTTETEITSTNSPVETPGFSTLTKEQIKELFTQSPDLFDFLKEKPAPLKYEYDIFEKYPTELKGVKCDLKESIITETEGKPFNLIIDNDTRRIAMQQRRVLGITLPELFRHAIWTYVETLTNPSTFNKETGHCDK